MKKNTSNFNEMFSQDNIQKNTIQNISTHLKTAKTAIKNNYLKNGFYENKNK